MDMGGENKSACCCGTASATKAVMSVVYDRNVHTVASHIPLKQTIPLEGCSAFGGKGQDLNPIDLMAMGLASCLMIVMGKTAEAEKLDIVGAKADVSYDLANYRIAAFTVNLHLPKKLGAAEQTKLETASKKCPVFLSISPEVKVSVNFHWPK
jgi:putative redox protein